MCRTCTLTIWLLTPPTLRGGPVTLRRMRRELRKTCDMVIPRISVIDDWLNPSVLVIHPTYTYIVILPWYDDMAQCTKKIVMLWTWFLIDKCKVCWRKLTQKWILILFCGKFGKFCPNLDFSSVCIPSLQESMASLIKYSIGIIISWYPIYNCYHDDMIRLSHWYQLSLSYLVSMTADQQECDQLRKVMRAKSHDTVPCLKLSCLKIYVYWVETTTRY